MTYVILALAIIFLTTGQLMQKLGAEKIAHQLKPMQFLRQVITIKEFILAVLFMSLGTACWLLVLLHMEVSKAYPFLSIGYVLIMFVSRFMLKEEISVGRWIGVLLIAVGTSLVAVS